MKTKEEIKALFVEYLRDSLPDGEDGEDGVGIVGASGFEAFLAGRWEGPEAAPSVAYGDGGSLDFLELAESVADEWEIEESGWDEYAATPVE